jgi:hypothetical protein
MSKRHRSLIIVVGSLCAGRLRHLNRIVATHTDLSPLVTLTTRTEPWPDDAVWYQLVQRSEITKHQLNHFLSLFTEGSHTCAVLLPNALSITKRHRIPIIGMTYEGIDRFLSFLDHGQALNAHFKCKAVYLQPEDKQRFCENLEREYGFDGDIASAETETAIRQSTIPPAAPRNSSIPVPINGTTEDDFHIDRALQEALS